MRPKTTSSASEFDPETVGTVQADRGAFADGEQPFDARFTLLVGFRSHPWCSALLGVPNRLFHRVDTHVGFLQLADERQTFQQFLLAEVTQTR